MTPPSVSGLLRALRLRLALCLCLTVPFVLTATAPDAAAESNARGKRPAKKASASKSKKKAKTKKRKRRSAKARTKKVCTKRQGKRRCRYVPLFEGYRLAQSALRTEPVPRPSGEIQVYAVNLHEEVTVDIYGEDGDFDDEALARLDYTLRCRRTNEVRAADPRLYEVMSLIYEHFGKRRIDLVSGFRNQTNEKSRHFHASAMDIRIPGVSTQELFEFASSLDTGNMGVGRYPQSDFVHIDFRAPGETSYRWTDYSGPRSATAKGKRRPKSKTAARKRSARGR